MRWMRGIIVAAVALAAACGGSTNPYGGGSGGGGQPGPNQVFMQNTAFNPATRTVAVGTTVQWVNHDGFDHTVIYSSGPGSAFNSGSIPAGGTFSVTFNTAGTVQYYCMIHGSPGAGMHGAIVVQ
jgi:plastocyanin